MARKEIKTIEGWRDSGCNSWDEYCKFGDLVDQEVADYFLNILPPQTMKREYFQVGEPHSYARNPKTGKPSDTYATFVRYGKEIWQYRGNCWTGFTMPAEKFRKYDCLKDFLRETYELVCEGACVIKPHIFCEDGFEMSVQAGDGLYCEPRVNLESGEYAACEVGYPSQKEELLMPYIEDVDKNFCKFNAKAILQEYTQGLTKEIPEYKLVGESGPAHDKTFEIEVSYQKHVIAKGVGKTKKEAEQHAAFEACKKLGAVE